MERWISHAPGVVAGACLLAAIAGAGPVTGARAAVPPAHTARGALAARASASLGPLINIPQTLNNCGPASIAEVLAYWGITRTQGEVQAVLRVDGLNRGMVSYGVPAYARSLGLRALVGVGGTESLVKALIAAGFPVIVSQQVSVTNPIGHYRPVEAYDDRAGVFVSSDPYLGPNYRIDYADFSRIWTRSGEGFIVLYPVRQQAALASVLASAHWNARTAYARDLARLQARLAAPSAQQPQWPGARRGYRYLQLAWDAVHAGQPGLARTYLQEAARTGANPIEVRWIEGEMA